MSAEKLTENTPYVRLARDSKEIEEAQSIRYQVFYEEYGAQPDAEMTRLKRDIDKFDSITDHLIVLAPSGDGSERIVGTYRLLRQDVAMAHGGFYSASEYDITPLIDSGQTCLELGRSCVLPDYRTRPVLQLLWQGIADYIADHDVDIMFGCASMHGTDIDALQTELSYLYHYHRAENAQCPRALDDLYVDMNLIAKEDLDAKRAMASLPPLIKGYLRVGCMIGDGAVIDHQFNTTDVLIIMPTELISERYRKHYERKIDKPLPGVDDEQHAAQIVKSLGVRGKPHDE